MMHDLSGDQSEWLGLSFRGWAGVEVGFWYIARVR